MTPNDNKVYVELRMDNGEKVQKEIRYDMNSIAEFERSCGKSFFVFWQDLLEAQKSGRDLGMLQALSIDLVRTFIWAGLLWRPNVKRHLTVKEVASMLSMDLVSLVKYTSAILDAMNRVMGVDDEKQAELEAMISENFTSDESSEASGEAQGEAIPEAKGSA